MSRLQFTTGAGHRRGRARQTRPSGIKGVQLLGLWSAKEKECGQTLRASMFIKHRCTLARQYTEHHWLQWAVSRQNLARKCPVDAQEGGLSSPVLSCCSASADRVTALRSLLAVGFFY